MEEGKSMEVPDSLAEEFGVAIQLGRLWHDYTQASITIRPGDSGVYKASISVPDGPKAEAHSQTALHALSRALTHFGLSNDLTDYP